MVSSGQCCVKYCQVMARTDDLQQNKETICLSFVSPSSLLSSSLVCRGWTLRSWVSPVSLPCQSSEDHKIGSRTRSGWSSLKTKVCPPVTSGLMNTIKRIKTGQTLRQNIWTFVSARRGWTIIKEINLTCLVCCLAAGYLLIFSIPSQWFMSLWV